MSCFLCSHPVTTATYTLSLHDALPISPGAAAVQEASFARDPIASRRGRRITRRVCYPIVRIGQLGVVAPNKRNRGRRDANVDRKSTRLNSSHLGSSYAVFCLKKKRVRE